VASVVGNEGTRGGGRLPEGTVSISALRAEAGLSEGTVSISTLKAEAERAPRKPEHRFFDRISLMSTGMETAGLLADGVTTMNRIGQVHTEYQTINGVQTPVQMRLTELDPVGK